MTPPNWVTSFVVQDHTLVVSFSEKRKVVSSAVCGGGFHHAQHILNHQVKVPQESLNSDAVQKWEDPSRYLGKLSQRLGLVGPIVGLMTAVDLTQLVLCRQEFQGLWVEGFFTVGVTNAVRAGDPVCEYSDSSLHSMPGTINIILVTNARLRTSAMVGAIGVATESKTAMLYDINVPSVSGHKLATGTGTDAMVIVSGLGPKSFRYSGTHTKIGELIGQVVSIGVHEGLQKARVWESRSKVL
jgi:adenosylcobinamide amidohydrolase